MNSNLNIENSGWADEKNMAAGWVMADIISYVFVNVNRKFVPELGACKY